MNKGEIMTNLNYLKKLKKTLPLLMLPLAYGANATDITATLTFETLPVITIEEVTAMDFGPVLSLAQAASCTMSATVGGVILEADDGVTGTTPAGGDLTAGTCSGGEGQPGVYTITSVAGADIKVSVTEGAATEIAFTPIGVVIDNTTRETINATGPLSPVVTATAALNAYTAAGTNRVIMGGTIVNQTTLTSGAPYTTTFDIDVVYQ
jgi:hypothetical protein